MGETNNLEDANRQKKTALTIAAPDIVRAPTPRRFRLTTLCGVRSEMAAIYRQARTGDLTLAAATRLVYILSQISRTLESASLEVRITALEDADRLLNMGNRYDH